MGHFASSKFKRIAEFIADLMCWKTYQIRSQHSHWRTPNLRELWTGFFGMSQQLHFNVAPGSFLGIRSYQHFKEKSLATNSATLIRHTGSAPRTLSLSMLFNNISIHIYIYTSICVYIYTHILYKYIHMCVCICILYIYTYYIYIYLYTYILYIYMCV